MIMANKIGLENPGRLTESYSKSIKITSVAITNDAKTIFAVGMDKCLKEIGMDRAELKKDIGVTLSQIAFPNSNKILFAGV